MASPPNSVAPMTMRMVAKPAYCPTTLSAVLGLFDVASSAVIAMSTTASMISMPRSLRLRRYFITSYFATTPTC